MNVNQNCDEIRAYFTGRKRWLGKLVIIASILLLLFTKNMVLFGILFVIGLGISVGLYLHRNYDFTYESEVDKATENEISKAEQRGKERLGLVDEQISLIKPITTTGQAPRVTTATDIILAQKGKGLFGRAKTKSALAANEDDPKYFVRIGSDDKLRYTLRSNTVFYFGENQLYIYWEHVDVATGLVYESGTHEYFYRDIESISTLREWSKQFSPRKKKYIRYTNEYVSVTLAGTRHKSAFRTYTEESNDNKEIEQQIEAMRNLVRDKKMQLV